MFLKIETRRLAESVDGLDTSLVLSPGELWLKVSDDISASAVFKGSTAFHNFGLIM